MAQRGPAALGGVVMTLHWSTMLVVAAWLFARVPGLVVLIHAGVWAGIVLIWGLRGGPSPALTGAARRIAHLSHPALLGVYLVGGMLAVLDHALARPVLLTVLAAGVLHGMFNLWRSSVLKDGALRRMIPKAMW